MSTRTKAAAKTHRSKRYLESREPRLVEEPKKALVLKGNKTSDVVTHVLRDLHKIKQPYSINLQKKNQFKPMEDASSLEFLCDRNNSPLFVFGSHSKKRPHNLVLGRMFEYQLLDAIEFGVDGETFRSMSDFEGERRAMVRFAGKPVILFQGEQFETNPDLAVVKSFFLDFFRGETLDKINLSSLDRIIIITAVGGKILFRHFGISLKKSDSKFPRVELDEVGPRIDFTFRRRKQGSDELVIEAMRQPKSSTKKNIERNTLGEKVGRVHMMKQDLSNVSVARLKGLKRKRGQDDNADDGENGTAASPEDPDLPAPKRRDSRAGGFGPHGRPRATPRSSRSQ